jgi:hypothetical protein
LSGEKIRDAVMLLAVNSADAEISIIGKGKIFSLALGIPTSFAVAQLASGHVEQSGKDSHRCWMRSPILATIVGDGGIVGQ